MDQQAEKDNTERVIGLGRRTREEIAKWNQMTALKFQTEKRHQTSPASLRGVAERTSSQLHLGAIERLGKEQDKLPCGPTGTFFLAKTSLWAKTSL